MDNVNPDSHDTDLGGITEMIVKLPLQRLTVPSLICLSIITVFTLSIGCGNDDDDDNQNIDPTWKIQSSAFAEGAEIPQRFTCDGEDISPALSWGDPPAGTESLALLMDDPDAPGRTFTHWILYNLPSDLRSLNENHPNQQVLAAVKDAKQGRNDFGNIGYGGPCPPAGPAHQYRFRFFALDTTLNLPSEGAASDFLDAIDGHVIAETRLTGLFSR